MIGVQHLLRAVQRSAEAASDTAVAYEFGWWEAVKAFVDSPAPYSPYSEYLLLLFILWLLARRQPGREDFGRQAQEVLDAKYRNGELSKEAYEKYRQEISMRLKR